MSFLLCELFVVCLFVVVVVVPLMGISEL